MKKRVGAILLSLIMAVICISACKNDEQVTTAEKWDKIMQDTFDYIINTETNYKIDYIATANYETIEMTVTATCLVVDNKGYAFNQKNNSVSYFELQNEGLLINWRSYDNGATFDRDEIIISSNNYYSGYFQPIGFASIGAFMVGNEFSFLVDLKGLFEYFMFSDGKYVAKEELFQLASFSAVEEFIISIKNGLISKIEFSKIDYGYNFDEGILANISYSFTYGNQSITLPATQ